MQNRTENRCYTCGNFKDAEGECLNSCCPDSHRELAPGKQGAL